MDLLYTMSYWLLVNAHVGGFFGGVLGGIWIGYLVLGGVFAVSQWKIIISWRYNIILYGVLYLL